MSGPLRRVQLVPVRHADAQLSSSSSSGSETNSAIGTSAGLNHGGSKMPLISKEAGGDGRGAGSGEVTIDDDAVGVMIERIQRSLETGEDLEALFTLGESAVFNWESIMAMRAQLVQSNTKKSTQFHRNNVNSYVERYRRGESVLDIARGARFPPYLLMKIMVEEIFPKARNTKKPLAEALANGDDRLKKEILQCEAEDTDYAPFADRIRQMAGLEYEYKLQRELRSLGVPFQHEVDLRVSGFHKTPDVLLPVPLGLATWKLSSSATASDEDATLHMRKGSSSSQQSSSSITQKPVVIRWIDSKAMFGDFQTHTSSNKEQLQGYVNRFGPGMVIYWFGFDAKVAQAYSDVIVVDRFPAHAIISL